MKRLVFLSFLLLGGPALAQGAPVQATAQEQLDACKSNLKNLGTALEMCAADNSGIYPTKVTSLFPKYLSKPPLCPTSGTDTYSASYRCGPTRFWCQFRCSGDHSAANVAKGLPAYTSEWGLINTPEELKQHYKREELSTPPLTR